ncbi:alpha-mannosidase [Paenibacillus oceani]|uniref:Alpha-mannosidase n=1 Tax=Paenibacillus oceani TaxID=2772510 RepID=A0A927CHE5_9BACL|nr:alpha-mannosidase [Paenibacillus oceani]MBD2866647.1 alpha-mannosidase [Paenibacillus oceani]
MDSSKKTAHIISHSHWDREWYLPFETHRHLLVKLMDTLLDTIESDPSFRSFHLDGQTIILDDYLAIRPEQQERLARHIREGRLIIGPWYVLQDEFLTSSEANVRNLQYGHRDAAKYGEEVVCKIGYFPDSFGNMGQAPQLLLQAGIDTAVFGRGVTPTGFNNSVGDAGEYESPYSEMMWKSPDGSSVLGILFANWYCNGMEVPVDPEQAKAYWDSRLDKAEKFASTPHLLFMNGCDHQPLQTDLTEAIRTAERLYPDTRFVHSSFEEYVQAVKATMPERLSVIEGELRSQRTEGWYTLVNTASARVYLKQMNHKVQTLLEKAAEPLAVFAASLGHPYPSHWLEYGWKTLMQNHPHDSICGCSVDEVHREMVTRFEKSGQVAENVIAESLQTITGHIDTSAFAGDGAAGESAFPFTVFNTSGWERKGTVSVELTVGHSYFSEGAPDRLARELGALPLPTGLLVDENGRPVLHTLDDLGVQFGYDLPDDKFRQPYMGRRIRLTFHSGAVPALGYRTYAWVTGQAAHTAAAAEAVAGEKVTAGERTLENRYLKVEIEGDGSLTVTEKRTGRIYAGLGVYEDTGDIGNEYIYKQSADGSVWTTEGCAADIRLTEDTGYRAAIEIVHRIKLPASADERLEAEIAGMVPFTSRKACRSSATVPMELRLIVELEANGKGVRLLSSFDNKAKDHRLRMLFPTDSRSSVHYADSIFEVARRDNEPSAEWKNPSNCQHQHAFASVHDETSGLTVANRGLQEYELVRDGRSTIAVTLVRSVAELGDWGVFLTPEAQCLRPCTAELYVIPHDGGGEEPAFSAYAEAYKYQIPWQTIQIRPDMTEAGRELADRHLLPASLSFLQWSGAGMAFSSLKLNEQTGDWMARWYNMGKRGTELSFRMNAVIGAESAYRSGILEDAGAELAAENGAELTAGGCEIVTVGIRPASVSR